MLRMLRYFRYGILLSIAFQSVTSFAGSVTCTGKLTDVIYHEPDGFCLTIGNNNSVKVRDPATQYFRTNPDNCKMIVSMALATRVTNKSLTVHVDNAPGSDCASIPRWFGSDVRYVSIAE